MKVSAIICTLLNTPDKKELIKTCVSSLVGYDELIVLPVKPGTMGYCESWNTAASFASGDYLIFISDDHVLLKGSLRDMCREDFVTAPVGNNVGDKAYWGGMFCVPRAIYEKYGLYDMVFDDGIHYMDTDLFKRYEKNNVKMIRAINVEVSHNDPGHTLKNIPEYSDKVEKNAQIYEQRYGHRD